MSKTAICRLPLVQQRNAQAFIQYFGQLLMVCIIITNKWTIVLSLVQHIEQIVVVVSLVQHKHAYGVYHYFKNNAHCV